MNSFRRVSIRWRITIGSVLVAAVLLSVAAYMFRDQIEQVQTAADKKLLYDAGTPYLTAIKEHPEVIDPPAGEQHVGVIDPNGRIVVSNLPDNLSGRVHDLTRLDDGSHFITQSGTHYLVIVRTVKTVDGDWFVVATRDQGLDAIIVGKIDILLITGTGILLAGFGLASWLLTTAALRPVTRMRRRAEALRATGSLEPLPVGPAKDELADLATTLNDFIASVRATATRERQMVSDASHELRTPIAVLKAQLELAHLSEGDAVALRNDLALAEESVGRLSRLATNLLELSALESEFDIQRTDWQLLVNEFVGASDRARLLAQAKQVTVEFDVDDTGGLRYRISPTHFGQILDNLISNAIRAVPVSGTVNARLSVDDGQLLLVVDDSGPGMPEAYIAIAFDRFTRPDEQRGATGGGSGLGLSIVSVIVSNAGGTVSLANAVEGGLIATVTLPGAGPSGTPP
ncbi:MAG: HAMP domain-containing sensor histidine kinase [Terrimesophilobacter sp.]